MVRIKSTMELLDKAESDMVIKYLLDRKKKGLYSLVLVAGLPGTGKTSTCFRLGELLIKEYGSEEKFTAESIIDNFLDLIKFVKDAKPEDLRIAVIEEISVLFPSRRAMSSDNVDLAKLLDTCRKKQIILLANAPIWTAIDSHMRSLGNVYIQTLRVYRKAKIVCSKFYRLQTDPRTGKTYTHCFQRNSREIKRMYTKMPNNEEWIKYEAKKDEFLDYLYNRVRIKAEKKKTKEDKEMSSHLKPTSIRGFTNKELQFINLKNVKKLNQTQIAKEMGVDDSRITRIKQNINKKLGITKEKA